PSADPGPVLARPLAPPRRRDSLARPDVEPRPLGKGRAPEVAAAVASGRGPVEVETGVDEGGAGPAPVRAGAGPRPDGSGRAIRRQADQVRVRLESHVPAPPSLLARRRAPRAEAVEAGAVADLRPALDGPVGVPREADPLAPRLAEDRRLAPVGDEKVV